MAKSKSKNSKNMEYLINYWRELFGSKLNTQGGLYAEGGPLKPDELQGELNIKKKYGRSILCYIFIFCRHHVRTESLSTVKS